MTEWALASAKPLAWGGWQFVLQGDTEKVLEWWPCDTHLSHEGRPFLGAPVTNDAARSARAAVTLLVERMNAP